MTNTEIIFGILSAVSYAINLGQYLNNKRLNLESIALRSDRDYYKQVQEKAFNELIKVQEVKETVVKKWSDTNQKLSEVNKELVNYHNDKEAFDNTINKFKEEIEFRDKLIVKYDTKLKSLIENYDNDKLSYEEAIKAKDELLIGLQKEVSILVSLKDTYFKKINELNEQVESSKPQSLGKKKRTNSTKYKPNPNVL